MAKTNTTTSKRKAVWQLSRKGVYGTIAGVLAACAWTFFLGVLVGRGTAPVHFDIEKLGQDLQALRGQVQQHQARQLEAYSAAVENKSEIDFYEDLKQPGEDPGRGLDLTRSAPQPSTAPDEERPEEAQAAHQTGEIPVKKPMPGLQPKKKGKVQRPQPVKKAIAAAQDAPATGSMTLQVASLRDARMADAMVARLRGEGYQASRSGVTLPDKGTWYRVQVGRFADREAASATLQALKAKGLDPILVSR